MGGSDVAECLRAGRPDRALFIRRLIAPYHKRRTSRPIRVSTAAVPHPVPATVSTGLVGTMSHVLRQVSAPAAVPEAELSPRSSERDFTLARSRDLLATWKCLSHRAHCNFEILSRADGRARQGISQIWIVVRISSFEPARHS